MSKHTIGPWYVENGSMLNRNNSQMLDEDIAILIESCPEDDLGVLLKVGTWDKVSKYYEETVDKYNTMWMPNAYKDMRLIHFNVKFDAIPEHDIPEFAPEGYNFTVDEICTIINWFYNHIGAKMDEFLKLPLSEAKLKIQSLQKIGF